MTLSLVDEVVCEPERNCGTTGVARVLSGYIIKNKRQNLINGYSNFG